MLMADAQTIGGYPIIATVIQVDIGKLAQANPGKTVKFKQVTINEAHELLLKELEELRVIKKAIEENSRKFEREFRHVAVKFGDELLDTWIRELKK